MAGDTHPVPHRSPPLARAAGDAPIRAVEQAVARLRFGVVQLTVHDGKVVQLDVTERQRFT